MQGKAKNDRTIRAGGHWLAEDDGGQALPEPCVPGPRRDGQAIVVCLTVALVGWAGVLGWQGLRLLDGGVQMAQQAFADPAPGDMLTAATDLPEAEDAAIN